MLQNAALLRISPSTLGWWGSLAARFGGLTGWRRRGAAVLAGAGAALALPPVGFVLVLLLCIPALVWMLDSSRSRRSAFGVGWWWGIGWFTAGLYWIANALLLEPERFGWMVPFATLGLSAVLAVFIGLATWLTHLTGWRGGSRLLALAAFWCGGEWLRSWVLTGFPWNPLGSVWDAVPSVLQSASVVGVFGLSLLTILLFGVPALLADLTAFAQKRRLVLLCFGCFVAISTIGTIRMIFAGRDVVPDIRFRLVQAALDQRLKGRSNHREQQLIDHINLTHSAGWDRITHTVWPETAVPFFLDQDADHRILAATAAPKTGLLLTGAPRLTPPDVEPLQIWNSMLAINRDGLVLGQFDKSHLVPFGEYVPLRKVLTIPKITPGGVDFTAGPGPQTLTLPGLPPVSPFICYEAIFPAAVVDKTAERPHWMLTLTNDGWFGQSAGPYQHLAAGRMRAVEEGLPLVRAANTGISAIIDPVGRTLVQLDLGQQGVVDGPLPKPMAATLFSRFGNAIPLGMAALALVFAAMTGRRQRQNASTGLS